jgi:tritrans,polycis-undecaprenyl-diphosphate synthase [geranylgeranyl-diphosphate specific]
MKPLHVGIILDGNRRFAKKLAKDSLHGHESGADNVENLFSWCVDLGIGELTLYCFSTENFKRAETEVSYLMKIFKDRFNKFIEDKRIDENKIQIKFVGKKDMLSKELQDIMKNLENKTKNYKNYRVNFALAYGGRQEILEAVKKMIVNKEEITEENMKKNLWVENYPDLIIRTGGDRRTSNFLPWQSVYSEWFFIDKMWPEFSKEDLKNIIADFENRERRFGK